MKLTLFLFFLFITKNSFSTEIQSNLKNNLKTCNNKLNKIYRRNTQLYNPLVVIIDLMKHEIKTADNEVLIKQLKNCETLVTGLEARIPDRKVNSNGRNLTQEKEKINSFGESKLDTSKNVPK